MKILFISSGNSEVGISPIIRRQGESLKCSGERIYYFTIKGKGLIGYLKNVSKLRKYILNITPDIIHSHYSLSAFTTSLANFGLFIPHVTSLMGSDVKMNNFWKSLIKINYKIFWKKVIVKSEDMKKSLKLSDSEVIPNGIDLSLFKKLKVDSRRIVGFNQNRRNIIWVSNPQRSEKNYQLAEKAVDLINNENIELHIINGIKHIDIPSYMYAADVLLLTSFREGSPNVVKEAMACNLPVVATNVGDVKWLFGKEPGYFLTNFDPNDVSKKIEFAIEFKDKFIQTKGRQRLIELGLDSKTIANKIIKIYEKVQS